MMNILQNNTVEKTFIIREGVHSAVKNVVSYKK